MRVLIRFARHDLFVADKELCRTLFRSTNDGQESADLFARDQSQLSTGWAREHSPVRIFLLPDLAGIFQDENGSRLHLFGDPLAKDSEFSDHVPSFRTVQ